MWEFVQTRWTDFSSLADKPEFLRLVVQRLAMTFAREGIDRMTVEVYGTPATGGTPAGDTVHPAEYYIKPPMGNDPALGDIRLRQTDGNREYLIVLWPTCDMVSTGGRTPKTDCVLCARASLVKDATEVAEWVASPSNIKQKRVDRLVKNTREDSPDRYHFLPGVWDIPDLLVDFQKLEHLSLGDVKALVCLATLASPFAEAIGSRFQRHISRVGTPDLNVDDVVAQIKARGTTTGGGASEL
jgi:hypothetical protein